VIVGILILVLVTSAAVPGEVPEPVDPGLPVACADQHLHARRHVAAQGQPDGHRAVAGQRDPSRLKITVRDLEAHYLAGGNVHRVVNALIAADRANIPLDFRRAAAIDLAGRDVLDAVQTSVNPKVIDCPTRATTAASSRARPRTASRS
jgi:hypothetical protein